MKPLLGLRAKNVELDNGLYQTFRLRQFDEALHLAVAEHDAADLSGTMI